MRENETAIKLSSSRWKTASSTSPDDVLHDRTWFLERNGPLNVKTLRVTLTYTKKENVKVLVTNYKMYDISEI